jgi:hypothetical protein
LLSSKFFISLWKCEPKTHELTQTYICTCMHLFSLWHTVTPSYWHFLTSDRHPISTRVFAEKNSEHKWNKVTLATLSEDPMAGAGGQISDSQSRLGLEPAHLSGQKASPVSWHR